MSDEPSAAEFLRGMAAEVEREPGRCAAVMVIIVSPPREGVKFVAEVCGWGETSIAPAEMLAQLAQRVGTPANEPTIQ